MLRSNPTRNYPSGAKAKKGGDCPFFCAPKPNISYTKKKPLEWPNFTDADWPTIFDFDWIDFDVDWQPMGEDLGEDQPPELQAEFCLKSAKNVHLTR